MAYMHIDNLYKDPRILMFREVYALEKIHGSSASVSWKRNESKEKLVFFAGGCKQEDFRKLFPDDEWWLEKFDKFGADEITVYGEVYGGKLQGMRETYGDKMGFIVFEVKIGDSWLNVPDAWEVAAKLGLEFVPHRKIRCTINALDAERDRDSVQAARNGMGRGHPREGIVIHPLEEMFYKTGQRVIVKHKSEKFAERKTPQKVDPDKLKVLREAEAIAEEWVVPMRLRHVVDKIHIPNDGKLGIEQTGDVIRAMIADVQREAKGEVEISKGAITAIGRRTAKLFKEFLREKFQEEVK